MRANKIIIEMMIVWGACFVPARSYAEEVTRVNVQQAVEMALIESEDYAIASNEIEKRFEQYRQVKSGIYPQLNAESSWVNNFEYPESAAATINDYSLGVGVKVSQLLWSFGKVSSAVKFAQKYADIARLQKDATKQDIAYAAKISYYSLVLAQNTRNILAASLDNAEKNKSLLEQRSAGGRSSKRDVIKMNADIASRIPRVNEAMSGLDSAERSFKVLIGVNIATKVELIESFADEYKRINKNKFLVSLQNDEPTLKALECGIEASSDVVAINRAEYYPTVAAFGSWDYKGIGNDADIGRKNLDNYGVAGIKVSVPLWTGGQISAKLRQARIERRNAELELKKVKKTLTLKLENAIAKYHKDIETLQANRQAVALAEESFKMAQDMFKSGQVTLADLNDAELLLSSERLNMQNTLFNINITMAKIEKISGV